MVKGEQYWRAYWKEGEADRFRDALRACLGLAPIGQTHASAVLADAPHESPFVVLISDGNRRVSAGSARF